MTTRKHRDMNCPKLLQGTLYKIFGPSLYVCVMVHESSYRSLSTFVSMATWRRR